jgi:hypothetical protein
MTVITFPIQNRFDKPKVSQEEQSQVGETISGTPISVTKGRQ